MADPQIESVLQEARVFPPPAALAETAQLGSLEAYQSLWDEVNADPDAFWGQQAREQLGRKPVEQQWPRGQADQREQQESGREHAQMQAPVGRARINRLARQLGAVQEEQQRDGRRRDMAIDHRRGTRYGHQAGENDGADERHHESVG